MSPKARRKASLMNTSKRVALTEADQVQDLNLHTNGQDLKTDHDMVEDTTETGASMTAAATDVEVEAEAEVTTKDLEVAPITEGVVATIEVDEEEDTTIEGIIAVEEEVEAMVVVTVVEGFVSSSRPTVTTNSQINSTGLATSRTTTNRITTSSNKFHKLRIHLSNSNSTTPTKPTASTTITTRDTKLAQDTNRPATLSSSRSNSNSSSSNSRRTVRQHSNRPIRITRTIMLDINSSNNNSSMEVTAAEVATRCVIWRQACGER